MRFWEITTPLPSPHPHTPIKKKKKKFTNNPQSVQSIIEPKTYQSLNPPHHRLQTQPLSKILTLLPTKLMKPTTRDQPIKPKEKLDHPFK